MPCGSRSDQIILKSPYMNQDFGLQLDDRNLLGSKSLEQLANYEYKLV